MRKIIIISFLIFCFKYFNAQCIPVSDLCDYQSFTEAPGLSDTEKQEREVAILKLIGIIQELDNYRQSFLLSLEPIDLFPTAYYHTTVSEYHCIIQNEFHYPLAKIEQLIAFYEAYKVNRENWESGNIASVELHWKKHFTNVSSLNTEGKFCLEVGCILTTGIWAHVKFDLPRAIRHTIDSNLDMNLLREDFKKTDGIFNTTALLTVGEISQNSSCKEWILDASNQYAPIVQNAGQNLSNSCFEEIIDCMNDPSFRCYFSEVFCYSAILGQILAYESICPGLITITGKVLTTDDVKQMRELAWIQAYGSVDILGADNKPVGPQPSPDVNYYYERGKTYCPPQSAASTLFLFDLSGSMNQSGKSGQSKLQEAKLAADATLTSIANDNTAGNSNEVCVMGFQGSCSSPISKNTGFKSNLASIKTDVNSLTANGGTPLVEAIEIAECELVKQLNLKGQSTGKLIVLSDGQATCQKIRPDETYIYGQSGKLTKNILSNQTCGSDILAMRQAGNGAKYYPIGFNIAPGSGAERDLQYLAQASGGKYLNVQSRNQLEKALKKFNRTYTPKPDPALNNLPPTAAGQFKQGVTEIMAESFFIALATCEFFVQSHPKDCHGVYNLALMQEANDMFLDAVKNYETYLSLCPTANDKDYVEKQIKRLEEEQRQFILFQKQVIISDLAYLKAYYQSLFNTRNEVLAKEFKGFIKEKGKFPQYGK